MDTRDRGRYNFYRSFLWNVIHYRMNRYPCHVGPVERYKIRQVRDWQLSIFVLAFVFGPPAVMMIIDCIR